MMLRMPIVKIQKKRIVSDKNLKGRDYEIAINPKYDGYQRGLASMEYKFMEVKNKIWNKKNVNELLA